MPKTKKARPVVSLAIADWKDVPSLLRQIAEALKPHGVVLQSWDNGTDDWNVTVADRKLTAAEAKREWVEEYDWTAEDAEQLDFDEITERRD